LVSATGNASYANLSVNTNLTGQLRSRKRPLVKQSNYHLLPLAHSSIVTFHVTLLHTLCKLSVRWNVHV